MLTKTWRRLRSPAAWALLVVLGVPMWAEAQQGGLFPLAPIRRQRVPCPMEDPVYNQYRHEYFGYFPTCWRRFPAGWGCPTPEAPNAVAAFKEHPRDPEPPNPKEGDEGTGVPGSDRDLPPGGAPGARPRNDQVPPLPSERSPFELDTKPGGAAPAPRDNVPGRPAPNAPPATNDSPLDLPAPGAEPPARPGVRPAAPARRGEPSAALPSPPAADATPLLALPDPAGPTSSTTTLPPGEPPVAGTVMAPGVPVDAMPAMAPTQAPRRTRMLSGLFGGFSFRRR